MSLLKLPCLLAFFILQVNITAQESTLSFKEKDSIIKSMYTYINGKPDYVIDNLNSLLTHKDNDSVTIAHIYSVLGGAYKSKSDHSKGLDFMLSALKYLETTESTILHGSITNNIGNIYDDFDLDEEALHYYLLSKKHYEKSISKDNYNNYSYVLLNIAGNKTYQKKYDEALTFIDKARQHLERDTILNPISKKIRIAITENEKANNLVLIKQVDSAEKYALKNSKILEAYDVQYALCLNYSYLGAIYKEKKEYKTALNFIRKADSIEQIFDNQEKRRDISFLYAKIYEELNNPERSYFYLKKGKSIEDSLFSIKGAAAIYRLRRDIEIKNEERKLMVLQKDKQISETRFLLYGISALALFGVVILVIINQRNKLKKEKEITGLELEKTTSELDFKKKELTTAALQIIENGEKVKLLKRSINLLKSEVDSKHHPRLNSLSSSLSLDTDKNWVAFKNSFEQVNTTFFENLKKSYPDLTPNDLKLCSFLKLNFNSKDIANFMGISHESVRISRYRLRKKMNLNRNENLAAHISNF